MVISFNSHDTTFASWHIFTCHNTLRLFKNIHNMKFRVVAVSLMPQRVVVVFSAQWAFSIFELNIETNPNGKILNRTRVYSMCRGCVDTGRCVTETDEVETQIKGAAASMGLGINESKTKYMKKIYKYNKVKKFRARYDNGQTSIWRVSKY